MAATFWALFQQPGSGGFASAAWIRRGSLDGATFGWLTPQIAFPDDIWAYVPDHSHTGYLAVDPRDNTFIWVCATVSVAGNLFSRCYLYDSIADSWTLLMDIPFVGPSTPFCVDMAFDADGTTFLALGGNGALGESGGVAEGGVYMSIARGMFAAAGSGHLAAYHSGNANNPQSLTALDIQPMTGGVRILYTAHNLVRTSGSAPGGWVTSFSTDDGAHWAEPVPFYAGNNFQIEALTVMRLFSGAGGLWYCSDNSGTGPYSTNNLSGTIRGTPATGPNGTFGGAIQSSGSIAYPFPVDSSRAVAFPTAALTGTLAYCLDTDGTWFTIPRASGPDTEFTYRGGRVARDSLYCAGVTLQRPMGDCQIWWSDDGGVNWHSDTAETSGSGLSLDFGAPVPPAPGQPWQQTATFRDARGFTSEVRFYVSGLDRANAETAARNIVAALINASTAQFMGASGPYNTGPTHAVYPTPDTYVPIEQHLIVQFTAQGISIGLAVPAPAASLFDSDGETPNILDPAYAALTSVGITDNLCTRGGILANAYVGGRRIMTARRRRQTIFTRNPTLVGPSE